jgi:hypothetical protein
MENGDCGSLVIIIVDRGYFSLSNHKRNIIFFRTISKVFIPLNSPI